MKNCEQPFVMNWSETQILRSQNWKQRHACKYKTKIIRNQHIEQNFMKFV